MDGGSVSVLRGITSLLTRPVLRKLQQIVQADDTRLLQGRSIEPPPIAAPPAASTLGSAPEGGCLLTLVGILAGYSTVGEALDYSAKLQLDLRETFGDLAVDKFMDWYDATPRAQLLRVLDSELATALAPTGAKSRREAVCA